MRKNLLKSFTAIGCASLLLSACSDYDPAALLNCEKAAFNLADSNTVHSLKMLSANMLRNQDLKLLSMEAYLQDSVRVILNIADTSYRGQALQNDSLRTGTYTFSLRQSGPHSGKALLGLKDGKDYKFLTTDTSAITILEIDVTNRNVSGAYYIETLNPARKLSGGFSKVCFQSIQ